MNICHNGWTGLVTSLIKVQILFTCLLFLPNVLFLFQALTQDITSHLILSPSAPLDCDHFSGCLSLIILTVERVQVKCFKQRSSLWVCRMFSLQSDRGYGFGEEDHWGQLPFSSHLIKGRSYQCDLCWCWPWLPSWGCMYEISPSQSHSFGLTFPRCPLGGIHYKFTAHTWRMGVGRECLQKSFGILLRVKYVYSPPIRKTYWGMGKLGIED